jgi:hypothetical protein
VKVWCPDQGETIDDARLLYGSVRGVAEIYAEKSWSSGDPFHSIDLRVADVDGREYDVTVDVEAVPNFCAGPSREVPPRPAPQERPR